MLSNAYFLAKFRFDTAENEPAKNLPILTPLPPAVLSAGSPAAPGAGPMGSDPWWDRLLRRIAWARQPSQKSSGSSGTRARKLSFGEDTSRRAAACGRAQLLAKKRHTGRVQNPGGVSENRPACGTAQHTLAVCFVFEKLEKSRKFLVKFGENS